MSEDLIKEKPYKTDLITGIEHLAQSVGYIVKAVEPEDKEAAVNTPLRVSNMMYELLRGYRPDIQQEIEKDFEFVKTKDLVVVGNIPFFSMCKHHMLPFFGKAHVGYLPYEKVIGLSKIPRVVRIFSTRLQLQERLGREICDCIYWSKIKPKGVIVVLEAQHLCMQMRGVESIGSITTTASLAGEFESNSELKREFYHLIKE